MKKQIFFILLLCLLLIAMLLSSCSGNHCIKVGGAYGDVGGEVEYCWDAKEAAESGVPVLIGTGQRYFGMTEEQIKSILAKLKEEETEVKIKSTKHFVNELLDMLEVNK